jgi:hypothetical protein
MIVLIVKILKEHVLMIVLGALLLDGLLIKIKIVFCLNVCRLELNFALLSKLLVLVMDLRGIRMMIVWIVLLLLLLFNMALS